MKTRLDILNQSLEKKKKKLNERYETHFETVKEANGQPLNDKRNGRRTLNKWDKQCQSIHNAIADVDKTKAAIERQEDLIEQKANNLSIIPSEILEFIERGDVVQWRRHPRILFVKGVDKARIIIDLKSKKIASKYVRSITDKSQYDLFVKIFTEIENKLKQNGN